MIVHAGYIVILENKNAVVVRSNPKNDGMYRSFRIVFDISRRLSTNKNVQKLKDKVNYYFPGCSTTIRVDHLTLESYEYSKFKYLGIYKTLPYKFRYRLYDFSLLDYTNRKNNQMSILMEHTLEKLEYVVFKRVESSTYYIFPKLKTL